MKEKDPIDAMEKQLIDEGYLTREEMDAIDAEIRAQIDKDTDEAEAMPDPTPESLYDEVYAK
jgi:2-oxoisovalerate dehydrogenase E1 component alpha subunit